jgi:hypothetical protein
MVRFQALDKGMRVSELAERHFAEGAEPRWWLHWPCNLINSLRLTRLATEFTTSGRLHLFTPNRTSVELLTGIGT